MLEKINGFQAVEAVENIKPFWDVYSNYAMYICLLVNAITTMMLYSSEDLVSCLPMREKRTLYVNGSQSSRKEILAFTTLDQATFINVYCMSSQYFHFQFVNMTLVLVPFIFLFLNNIWYEIPNVVAKFEALLATLDQFEDLEEKEDAKDLFEDVIDIINISNSKQGQESRNASKSEPRSGCWAWCRRENSGSNRYTSIEMSKIGNDRSFQANDNNPERTQVAEESSQQNGNHEVNDRTLDSCRSDLAKKVETITYENLQKLMLLNRNLQRLSTSIRGKRYFWYYVLIVVRSLLSCLVAAGGCYLAVAMCSTKLRGKPCDFPYDYELKNSSVKNSTVICFVATKWECFSSYCTITLLMIIYFFFSVMGMWNINRVPGRECLPHIFKTSFCCWKCRSCSCGKFNISYEFAFFFHLLQYQKPHHWDYVNKLLRIGEKIQKCRNIDEEERLMKTEFYYCKNKLVPKENDTGAKIYQIDASYYGVPSSLFMNEVDSDKWHLIIKGLYRLKTVDFMGFYSFRNLEHLEIIDCQQVTWPSLTLKSLKSLTLSHVYLDNKDCIVKGGDLQDRLRIEVPKLETLRLTDVRPLKSLLFSVTRLTSLYIGNTEISSFDFMSELKFLVHFELNKVKYADGPWLSNLMLIRRLPLLSSTNSGHGQVSNLIHCLNQTIKWDIKPEDGCVFIGLRLPNQLKIAHKDTCSDLSKLKNMGESSYFQLEERLNASFFFPYDRLNGRCWCLLLQERGGCFVTDGTEIDVDLSSAGHLAENEGNLSSAGGVADNDGESSSPYFKAAVTDSFDVHGENKLSSAVVYYINTGRDTKNLLLKWFFEMEKVLFEPLYNKRSRPITQAKKIQDVRVFLGLKASNELDTRVTELEKWLKSLNIEEGTKLQFYCYVETKSNGPGPILACKFMKIFKRSESYIGLSTGAFTSIPTSSNNG